MEKIIKADGKTVKKETMWIVASMALVVGFLGGVAFGVYKSSSSESIRQAVPSQPIEAKQDVSVERAAQIFELEKRTKESPDDVTAWTHLANLYFDTGNYKNAIKAYLKSLELRPNDPNVMTDLGIMYRRNGQPKKAVEMFDQVIKVDPGHETARFNKGIVLMHDLNDFEGAVRTWEELVKMNPKAISPTGQPVKDLVEKLKKSMKP